MEKAALQQLLVHCEKNHAPLPKFQSGFRKYHSTENALLKVQNDILMSMDKKQVTLLVLLDLSAAFDTIEHSILLNILQQDFGDIVIKPLESVRNLGSWFDAHMRRNVHIGNICSKAFRGLYNIIQIRKFLTAQSTKTLIHVFVSSHLDYCNAFLFALPKYQLDRL